MYKIYTLLIAALLVTSVTRANKAIDSIGVENNKGKKLILHKVDAKETYYSIAKRYGVNYKDVLLFNENKFLQVGVIIKVPTEIPFTAPIAATTATSTDAALVEYTIKAKDNLNMLAERYGTTVNEIKRVNNLNTINLRIGQVLKIPNNAGIVAAEVQPTPIATDNTKANTAPIQTQPANVDPNGTSHTVKAKENLNLIAEKYETSVEEIKKLNGLTSNNLRIGQILKIPTGAAIEAAAVTPSNTPTSIPKTEVPQSIASTSNTEATFEHIVAAGETIYSIAKHYNLTTYQLKSFNNLNTNEVSIGQKLIIKGARPVQVQSAEEVTAGTNTIKDPSLRYAPSSYGIIQVEEKGRAVWIADADLDATKMLVLHRTAPVGTIIKVTNPMSNRSAFAKVVGKFTENETTKDVIIVMTKAVADAVGALDKRFMCNLTYGAQENEQ